VEDKSLLEEFNEMTNQLPVLQVLTI